MLIEMKPFHLLIVLLFLFSAPITAQDPVMQKGLDAITQEAVEAQLNFLASDWTEGRAAGTRGEYIASDYIASMFKLFGLKPGGDISWINPSRADRMKGVLPTQYQSYFQTFPLVEYVECNDQQLELISESKTGSDRMRFKFKTDFDISGGDIAIEKTAPLIFVGYGLSADTLGYNDFKGVDVKGKFIVRLAGFPGYKDTGSLVYKKFIPDAKNWRATYRINQSKNKAAKDAGAAGIIEITPGEDEMSYWATNTPFRINTEYYEGDKSLPSYYNSSMRLPGDSLTISPVQVYVSKRLSNALFSGTGIDPAVFEKNVLSILKPASKELPGKKLYLRTTTDSKIVNVRNVIGVLEGEDTSHILVIGGHYDHLGKSEGYIFNGADDNASGTVGVMTLAKAYMATGIKPKITIVFAAWTAEERGLLGSTYFVDHPYKPLKNIIMNLNYDMIAKDGPEDTLKNTCSMTYTKAYKSMENIADKNNKLYNLALNVHYQPAEKPGGGSDHAPFANKLIPIMYFMAGFTNDYHGPFDHVEKVDFDKMTRIIRLGFVNTWEIANMDTPLGNR
jgi:hypothetical protein